MFGMRTISLTMKEENQETGIRHMTWICVREEKHSKHSFYKILNNPIIVFSYIPIRKKRLQEIQFIFAHSNSLFI